MLGEGLRIDGRRRDHQFQIRPLHQQALQVTEQEVDVQRALMCFIQDQHRVGPQHGVALNLGKQDAIGHELHARVTVRVIAEAHLAPDLAPPGHTKFFSHALGHTHRRHSPRLRAADLAANIVTLHLQAHLGQLRRLARSCFTRQNHHLMITYRRNDLLTAGRDGQVSRVTKLEHRAGLGAAMLTQDFMGAGRS